MADLSSSSSILIQRFEFLKRTFSSLNNNHKHRCLHLSYRKKNKSLKLHRRKISHSIKVKRTKQCIVALESTYRHNLQLNTTYIIGKTIEGQSILLPKQIIEHDNIITLMDNEIVQHEKMNISSAMNYSDISNDEEEDKDDNKKLFRKNDTSQTTRMGYTSQGNVVTCVTGSFD